MTPAQLEAALIRPDGSPVDLERIEIEVLPGDRFRWGIFADGRRVFAIEENADQVQGMLRITGIMLEGVFGIREPA